MTRKISLDLSRIKLGIKKDPLELGNLDAVRDWGYAPEYVDGMWRMLQQEKPDDYVLATGEGHTVRDFVNEASRLLGFDIEWRGKNADEIAVDQNSGKTIVKINKRYFRPTETGALVGDYSKAKRDLNWAPKVTFKELVRIMVSKDLERLQKGEIVY